MPLHRRKPAEGGAQRDELVAELAGELRAPKPVGQPIIIEDDTPETNSVRVHVIWDRWHDCPGELRSGVILDAYATAEYSDEFVGKITFALGVTIPEATEMGLVPFQVVPGRRKDERPTNDEYRQAMIDAGASILAGKERPQIRCATIEDAEKTIERLETRLPGSKWIVAQEVGSLTDYYPVYDHSHSAPFGKS
jgi:hypothetical protein